MDKGVTPPSGDKHDYMSQAPIGGPIRPSRTASRTSADGERNPEIKQISDHDNLGRVTSAVSTLGLAYRLTGREEYATQAARLVRVWFLDPATRMNPHLRFGQGIPGINDGRGIGIIETTGLPDMLDGVIAIAASPAWTAADQAGLQPGCARISRGCSRARTGRMKRRTATTTRPGTTCRSPRWRSSPARPRSRGAPSKAARPNCSPKIEPDGRQPRELSRTRAWHYSAYNLTAFFNLATLGKRVGVDLWTLPVGGRPKPPEGARFLVPFAAGERKWTYRANHRVQPGAIHVSCAEPRWRGRAEIRALADKVGGGGTRLMLPAPS